MSEAVNYRNWLYTLLDAHVHGHVLEIGSGIGNMTHLLLANHATEIQSITCVEPETRCISLLEEVLSSASVPATVINGFAPDCLEPCEDGTFDLVFHFNVLEHVEEDKKTLERAYALLKPGGIHFIFVPAFPMLYGSMDRELLHFRRYTKRSLGALLEGCGYAIIQKRYFNLLGFAAWFYNNRIRRITSQVPKQIRIFDRYVLPPQAFIEGLIRLPFGQSLLMVGRKPQTGATS